MEYKSLVISSVLPMLAQVAHMEQIGPVDMVFEMFGPDHKIVVEMFDGPDATNVTCYVSHARTGGIKSGLRLAEDISDAVISYRQIRPVELSDGIKNGRAQGEVVFKRRTSLVFKSLQVVCFHDTKRGALAYLTYSDEAVDRSPKDVIDAALVTSWW